MRRLDRLALSVLALGCLGNFAAAQAPTELTGGSPVPAQQSLPPAAVLTPPPDWSVLPGHGAVDGCLAAHDCETHHWEFFTAATAYLLKPYFENNAAFTTTTGVGTTHPFQTESDFGWNYTVSPALTVGIVSPSGLGVRARYFQFDEGSSTLHTSLTPDGAKTGFIDAAPGVGILPGGIFGSPGVVLGAGAGTDQLYFTSTLKIHSFDGEVMQKWDVGRFSLIVSGGGRYLDLEQFYSATLSNKAVFAGGAIGRDPIASELQSLVFNQRFQGAGPTVATEGRVRIGNSGLSVFANARGTLLVGTTHQTTNLVQVVTDPAGLVGGSSALAPSIDNRREHVLPVAELELGVEYCLHLRKVEPFLRAAVVDMTYFDAGNASRQDGNLSLFGGQLTFGLKY